MPLPELSNEWSGEFTLVNESTWEGGFCSTVSISNPTTRAATDFLISLDLRNTQITTLWGLKIESNSQGKMTLKPDRSILIKPGEVSEDEMIRSIWLMSRRLPLLVSVERRLQQYGLREA